MLKKLIIGSAIVASIALGSSAAYAFGCDQMSSADLERTQNVGKTVLLGPVGQCADTVVNGGDHFHMCKRAEVDGVVTISLETDEVNPLPLSTGLVSDAQARGHWISVMKSRVGTLNTVNGEAAVATNGELLEYKTNMHPFWFQKLYWNDTNKSILTNKEIVSLGMTP